MDQHGEVPLERLVVLVEVGQPHLPVARREQADNGGGAYADYRVLSVGKAGRAGSSCDQAGTNLLERARSPLVNVVWQRRVVERRVGALRVGEVAAHPVHVVAAH